MSLPSDLHKRKNSGILPKMINFKKHTLATLAFAVFFLCGLGLAMPAPAYAVSPECGDIQSKDVEAKLKQKFNGMDCIIERYVNPFIAFLGGVTGVAVVAAIIIGGIQYSSAGGDPGKVAEAKSRITKAILALLAFIFLLAFISFILPGGIGG